PTERAVLQGFLQEVDHVGGVAHAIVLVAVVHENVDLAGLVSQVLDAIDPRAELTACVEGLEALGGGGSVGLPRVAGAAMEAYDGDISGGGRDWEEAADLRGVDNDEREVVIGQELQSPVEVVLLEPAGRAQLDADRDLAEALAGQRELVAVVALRREPRRVLQQDGAEPARLEEWRQRLGKAAPHLVDGVGRQMVR